MFAFRPEPALSTPGFAPLGASGRVQVRPSSVLTQRRAGGFWFGRRAPAPTIVPAAVAAAAPVCTSADWDQLDPDQRVRLLGEW